MPTFVKRKTCICLRCGHGADPAKPWVSTKDGEDPKQCPNCKSYKWNTPVQELYDHSCRQCGAGFKSPLKDGPVKCPRCKSFAWNRNLKSNAGRPRKDRKKLEDGDSSEEE
jgi:DNA-directed RNA polymerase subunit RPC12/RpoP